MHGRKASPTINLGKSNTTKVCHKPLCGSKNDKVSNPSYLDNVMVVFLHVLIMLYLIGSLPLWSLSIRFGNQHIAGSQGVLL